MTLPDSFGLLEYIEVYKMVFVLLGLIGISLTLLIISFFQKDPVQLLREELEQFTLQQLQENYLIKKKMKLLEEELLVNEDITPFTKSHRKNETVHEIIKNQVLSLAQQGATMEQISNQSSLTVEEVRSILIEHNMWGDRYS